MGTNLKVFSNLELKISIFNTIGFIIAAGEPTIFDSFKKVGTYNLFFYPLGPYIFLISPMVFLSTYYAMSLYRKKFGIITSWLPLLLLSLGLIWNFNCQFPDPYYSSWISLYIFISFLTTWIESKQVLKSDFVDEIHHMAKIEYLKESCTHWRLLSLTLIGGYLTICITWLFHRWDVSYKLFPETFRIYNQIDSATIFIFSIIVLLGPINSLLQKTEQAREQFLKIDQKDEV